MEIPIEPPRQSPEENVESGARTGGGSGVEAGVAVVTVGAMRATVLEALCCPSAGCGRLPRCRRPHLLLQRQLRLTMVGLLIE